METLLIFLENFLLSLAGLLFYVLWVAREHLYNFNWNIFYNKNKVFWLWAFLVQLLYTIIMSFYTELEQTVAIRLIASLNSLMDTEWNVNEEITVTIVYLTGTWQLSRFAKRASTKK